MAKITTILRKYGKNAVPVLPYLAGLAGLIYLGIHLDKSREGFQSVVETFQLSDPALWIVSALLAAGNWLARIWKWKTAVAPYQTIGFKVAACQQLKTFSWSAFTPLNSGEWAGKKWFMRRSRGVLRAVSYEQFSQMAVTVLTGMTALTLSSIPVLLAGIPLVWARQPIQRKKILYGLQLLGLSAIRYAVFAGFLVWMFHRLYPQPTLYAIGTHAALYYLWISLLPLAFWWDVPVKGSVAVWQFGLLGFDATIVTAIILWMWAWNTLLPVIAGQILLWTNKKCGYV